MPSEVAREVVLEAANFFFQTASSLEAEEIGLGQVALSLLPHDEEVRQQGLCLKALQELQYYGLHLLPRDHTQVCRIGASELDTAKTWTSENLLCSCVCPTDDLLDAYMWQVLRNLVCKFDSTL